MANVTSQNEDGFSDYVIETTDPGIILFLSTCLFCIISICITPCLIVLVDRYSCKSIGIKTFFLQKLKKNVVVRKLFSKNTI